MVDVPGCQGNGGGAELLPAPETIKSSDVLFCTAFDSTHPFWGRRATKGRGDEACLGASLASAKWRRDAASLESKGQPEDRWQANHVENESCGKCTGRGWRPLRGVHLSLTGPGLTWNKTSSAILHYACQLAPSPRDTPHNSIFCPAAGEKTNPPPLEAELVAPPAFFCPRQGSSGGVLPLSPQARAEIK